MAHILGRIVGQEDNRIWILGYLVQYDNGDLCGISSSDITRNPDKFKNIEAIMDKDLGLVLKEKGISEDLMNYFTIIAPYNAYPVSFNILQKTKRGVGLGSIIVLNKNMLGYSILTIDGILVNVTEKSLIAMSQNIPLYNAIVRNDAICMKSHYDVPDFRLSKNLYNPSDILVLDTETTGVCKDRQDEVLQLAIIDGNGKTVWNKLYKPEKITEWSGAMAVNHITPEMVANCPTIRQDMPVINKILAQAKVIVGYNTTFDLDKILKPVGARWTCETEDVMRVFAPVYGETTSRGTFKWKKLGVCTQYCGYNWGSDTAHDGLADCRATLHCYKTLLNMGCNIK